MPVEVHQGLNALAGRNQFCREFSQLPGLRAELLRPREAVPVEVPLDREGRDADQEDANDRSH